MSRLLLALIAAFPLHPHGSQDPAADPDESPIGDIGSVPASVLLTRMPKDLWNRDGSHWTLKSVPQELQRRAENGLLSDDDWRAVLVSEDVIHMRTRWLAGKPLGVWIRQPVWLRVCKITARAVQPDLGTVASNKQYPSMCGNCAAGQSMRMRKLAFDALPSGTERVRIEVAIEQRAEPEKSIMHRGPPRELWRGELELPVEACADVDEVLPPTSTPAQNTALMDSLRAFRSGGAADEDRTLMLQSGGENERFPALRGVGVSLEVELLHDAQVVEYTDMVVDQDMGFGDTKSGLRGYCNLFHFPVELDAPGADLSGWALRLRGRPDHLLQVWEADSWWSGTETIPLSQVLANSGN